LAAAGNGAPHTLARNLAEAWHPAVRRIVDGADIPDTFLVTVASARPVPPWQVPNGTLLGDASHTISPGRGEGGNVALRDAALLRRTLACGELKQRYETQMMQYAFDVVADSRDKPFLRGPRR
jgi:2-polyprenyl-6-methoxyphenol hydroxylase-like FAD-dependent oxidoreductase